MEQSTPHQETTQAILAATNSLSPFPLFLLSPFTTFIGTALNSTTSTRSTLTMDSTTSASTPASAAIYSNETTGEFLSDDLFSDNDSYFMLNAVGSIFFAFEAIQYIIFHPLRCSERQHLRETFWDYFIQKIIFIFFVLDSETLDERSQWVVWFTVLGFVLLTSKLCKDRFEYLSSSPSTKSWPLIKISILMSFLLLISLFFTILITMQEFTTYLLFQLADATYVLIFVMSVITRFIVLTYDMRPNSVLEKSASISYYTDLLFSFSMLAIELFHHVHLIIVSNASMLLRFLCLTKVHTLVMEIKRRYKRHKHYLLVVELMENNFAIATPEELDNFRDECAICWDSMQTARKLPCGHFFHNSCLRSWLEQDTSCPTCRTSYKGQHRQQQQQHNQNSDDLSEFVADESSSDGEDDTGVVARAHQRNHLFHFDSSRYTNHPLLRWLPRISIEGFI